VRGKTSSCKWGSLYPGEERSASEDLEKSSDAYNDKRRRLTGRATDSR